VPEPQIRHAPHARHPPHIPSNVRRGAIVAKRAGNLPPAHPDRAPPGGLQISTRLLGHREVPRTGQTGALRAPYGSTRPAKDSTGEFDYDGMGPTSHATDTRRCRRRSGSVRPRMQKRAASRSGRRGRLVRPRPVPAPSRQEAVLLLHPRAATGLVPPCEGSEPSRPRVHWRARTKPRSRAVALSSAPPCIRIPTQAQRRGQRRSDAPYGLNMLLAGPAHSSLDFRHFGAPRGDRSLMGHQVR
jgi:hypothetical protein